MTHNILKDFLYSLLPFRNLDRYLTYRIGNCPVIISAPHGGDIRPIDIPPRTYGNRSRDTYTRRLIQLILEELDKKPYFIYSDIHRSRVDLNRDIAEGCQGNKKAEQIWSNWNLTLGKFTDVVANRYGKGLYIDLHSHNNSNRFQIGYGLTYKEYNDLKSGWKIKSKSTLYAIDDDSYSSLFGAGSIINTIEKHRYGVLTPIDNKHYLNGGRNIKEFYTDKIGAIQIECPIPILKYDLNGIARTLVDAIEIFSEKFLNG